MLADLLPVRRKAMSIALAGSPYRTAADELDGFMTFGSTSTTGDRESIDGSFDAMISRAYKASGPVFTCILARAMPFSEARFQFQEMLDGRPGRLFDGPSLGLLANPWTNATTGELLWRMEQDASLAGNFFATVVGSGAGRRIRRMRPDWVTVISGVAGDPEASSWSLDSQVLGYVYAPNGRSDRAVLLSPDRVVHYSPLPDPEAQWRGMSWISPLADDVLGDRYATKHKLKFFENGATSNLVVTYDAARGVDEIRRFKALFDESHRGVDHAYKVIHLGGGADMKALGADLAQLDFKATQGAGETRIAAAAGVGAIIARFSEGLQGSSLNAGNYDAAKRQFADMTLRPLWRAACAALSKPEFVSVPAGARLWVDDRDIQFLKDDRKGAAEIRTQAASTIKQLIDAGFAPDAVIDAVEADDLSRLIGTHSGLYSVQLRPAGDMEPGEAAKAASVLDMVQKVHGGVGSVLRADEVRSMLNAAGAGLSGLAPVRPSLFPPPAPTSEVHVPITVVEPKSAPITIAVPEGPAPVVNVTVPEQAAPVVNVTNMAAPLRSVSRRVERDADGRIVRVIEEGDDGR